MEVRKYREEDYGQIERIYNLSRPGEFYAEQEQFTLECWADDEYIQSIFEKSQIYICGKNRVLGFCGFLDTHINWLFVTPECRCAGVASRLLTYVLPIVGSSATLTVAQSNTRAMGLYSKFGFIVKRSFVVEYQAKDLAVHTLALSKCA